MTFRARLTLLLVLIVVVPIMTILAILELTGLSPAGSGRSDARLQIEQRTATNLYRDAVGRAADAMDPIGRDAVFATALQRGDAAVAARRAGVLLRRHGLSRIVVADGDRAFIAVGDTAAIAEAQRTLTETTGRRIGVLEVSDTTAERFAKTVQRLTGADVVVRVGRLTLATTLPAARTVALPSTGRAQTVSVGGVRYRAAAFSAPTFLGGRLHVAVLEPRGGHPRLLVLIVLAAALLLAILCALYMSHVFQLERAAEVAGERARWQASLRRVGEAFASGLNRDALLQVVLDTAVDGVEALGGRACISALPGAQPQEVARAHDLDGLRDALAAAESEARTSHATSEAGVDGTSAIAYPLRGSHGVLGTIAIARAAPFADTERELFAYLAAQAAVAMENVGLHEAVQRQAVTDELTGLANHRRFQEAIDAEAERARRFGQPLALVMLDLDDFKAVNDTYGHQQGDVVLAEVARVLRASSRDIDSPARYGGEEFALILPQTDLEGGHRLAERVRTGIAALRIPVDGASPLRVTASLGVAALPESATGSRDLLARADAALYEAKRAGKNKTVRAR